MDEELLLTIKRAERFRLRQRGTGLFDSKSIPPLVILPPYARQPSRHASKPPSVAAVSPPPISSHVKNGLPMTDASHERAVELTIDGRTALSSLENRAATRSSSESTSDKRVVDLMVDSFDVEYDQEEVSMSASHSEHREEHNLETDPSILASQRQDDDDVIMAMSPSGTETHDQQKDNINMPVHVLRPQEPQEPQDLQNDDANMSMHASKPQEPREPHDQQKNDVNMSAHISQPEEPQKPHDQQYNDTDMSHHVMRPHVSQEPQGQQENNVNMSAHVSQPVEPQKPHDQQYNDTEISHQVMRPQESQEQQGQRNNDVATSHHVPRPEEPQKPHDQQTNDINISHHVLQWQESQEQQGQQNNDVAMSHHVPLPEERRDIDTSAMTLSVPPPEQQTLEIDLSEMVSQPQEDHDMGMDLEMDMDIDMDLDVASPPLQSRSAMNAILGESSPLPQAQEQREPEPAMSLAQPQPEDHQTTELTAPASSLQPQTQVKDSGASEQAILVHSPQEEPSRSELPPQKDMSEPSGGRTRSHNETVSMDITAPPHLSVDLDDFEFDDNHDDSRPKEATPEPPASETSRHKEDSGADEHPSIAAENEDEFVFDFEDSEIISPENPAARGRSDVTSVNAIKRKSGRQLTVLEEVLLKELLATTNEDDHGEITVDVMRENVVKVVDDATDGSSVRNAKRKAAELATNMAMNYLRLCALDTNLPESAVQETVEIFLDSVDKQLKRQLELYDSIIVYKRKQKRLRLLQTRAVNRMREARQRHQELHLAIAEARRLKEKSRSEELLYSDLMDLFNAFDITGNEIERTDE